MRIKPAICAGQPEAARSLASELFDRATQAIMRGTRSLACLKRTWALHRARHWCGLAKVSRGTSPWLLVTLSASLVKLGAVHSRHQYGRKVCVGTTLWSCWPVTDVHKEEDIKGEPAKTTATQSVPGLALSHNMFPASQNDNCNSWTSKPTKLENPPLTQRARTLNSEPVRFTLGCCPGSQWLRIRATSSDARATRRLLS